MPGICQFCKYYKSGYYGNDVCLNKVHSKLVIDKIGDSHISRLRISNVNYDIDINKCFEEGFYGKLLRFYLSIKRKWYEYKLR